MQMYEPVTEGSYIKMIDMVSGRGKMEVNISSSKGISTAKRLPKQFILACDGGIIHLCFHFMLRGCSWWFESESLTVVYSLTLVGE